MGSRRLPIFSVAPRKHWVTICQVFFIISVLLWLECTNIEQQPMRYSQQVIQSPRKMNIIQKVALMLCNGIFQIQCFLLKPEQLVIDYSDKDSHKIDPLISQRHQRTHGAYKVIYKSLNDTLERWVTHQAKYETVGKVSHDLQAPKICEIINIHGDEIILAHTPASSSLSMFL